MQASEHDFRTAAYARAAAYERQGGLCASCHAPLSLDRFEAHHRKSRRALGWCRCNVVALHPRCHTQGALAVHDNVAAAVWRGLIVPTHLDTRLVPIEVMYPWRAWVYLRCDGTVETARL